MITWKLVIDEHTEGVVNTVNCVGVMGKGSFQMLKYGFTDRQARPTQLPNRFGPNDRVLLASVPLLVKMLAHYQAEGYKKSLLEIQKLAYFLQVSSQSMDLKFEKEKYGPYAEKLNFVLQKMEGHYLRGYGDRSRAAEIQLTPGAIQEAEAALVDDPINDHVSRVVRLIEGYETPWNGVARYCSLGAQRVEAGVSR